MTGAEPPAQRGLHRASMASGSVDAYVSAQHPAGADLPTTIGDPNGAPDDLDKEPMPLDRSALEARVAKTMAQRPAVQPGHMHVMSVVPTNTKTCKRSIR